MNNFKWYKFLTEDKAATEPLLREITPRLEEYSQVVMNSIVDKQYFFVKFNDGARVGLVLETQKGRIPFYRSTGRSSEVKQEGEWTIFKGMQPYYPKNYTIMKKNPGTFNLTQGGDRYLSILTLVLAYMWNEKQLINNLERVDFYEISKQRLNQVNQKIQELNQQEDKYIEYDLDELQAAYLNSYLQDKDALSSIVFDPYIPEKDFVGLKEIKSEHITQLQVANKFLPILEDVLG